MKKASLLFLIALLVSTIILDSCKKDEPTPEPTKSELLTNGNWTGIKAESYDDNILVSTEIITEDVFEFKTDGSGIHYYQGAVDELFQWSFNTDKTSMYIDYGNGDIWSLEIEALTQTQLTLSDTEEYNGVEYKDLIYLGR